ncbi:MAG TPA: hypothetical protein ENI85_04740 [Deltaproteobacteria bacterium]|nr:hypothetical protein [Deltaproteobacteria bacterium]
MEGRARQIVFLHSMWRARSTWLFGRFRESGRYRCYYEPLNEALATLDASALGEDARARGDLRHPPLAGGYWQAYRTLLPASGIGVEGFEERFAFHRFGPENDPGPYFDRLIDRSPRSSVLFKLNRSAYRIAWFTARHPRARHFFLERDPRDQFRSYRVDPAYFLPMQLVLAWLQPPLREKMRRRFPDLAPSRFERMGGLGRGEATSRLRRFFRKRLERSDEEHRWAIFEFLHVEAGREARSAGAAIVDVDDHAAIETAFGPLLSGPGADRRACAVR